MMIKYISVCMLKGEKDRRGKANKKGRGNEWIEGVGCECVNGWGMVKSTEDGPRI